MNIKGAADGVFAKRHNENTDAWVGAPTAQ